MATRMKPDALVVDHGSLFRVIPWSAAARAWVDRYIGKEAQRLGLGFVVEPRYLQSIVRDIQASGLLLVPVGPGEQRGPH